MTGRLGVVLVGVGLALAGWARAAPLEAYGELPTIEQVAISPSGGLLAIDYVKGENREVIIEDLAARKLVAGFKAGDVKIRNLQWAGDSHVIITSSSTGGMLDVLVDKSEWFVAADYNIPAKRLRPLLGDVDLAGNWLAGYPVIRTVDGKPTVFAIGDRFSADGGMVSLFKVDLDTDHSSVVLDSHADGYTSYLIGADGRPLAMEEYDAKSKAWALKLWHGAGWRQALAESAAIETPGVLGAGRDGQSVLIGQFERGHYTLREVSPDGVLGEPLPIGENGAPIHDPIDHRLIGFASLDGDSWSYSFFDPSLQSQWQAIVAAFPGQGVRLASWSDDRKRVVLHLNSPSDGPGYALVDLRTGASSWLGADYPGLTSADISPVKPVRFKAADGLELSGYLTLPQGREPKNLPLVVFPHGGPAVRDEPWFDWWAQAMASRGYAVLQVNYRGSDGFGWKFMSAGFGEWGRKMQTDLSDGVRYLAAEGTIDPQRVCVVGASYGGYAALAGATLDPGVYRCAVDAEGLSDLPKFVAWSKDREGGREGVGVERYWTRFMGADGAGDPRLEAISPLAHIDRISIPILIIHGKDDTVVPFEQSQMMADALKRAGKPYDFVVLNHEDHWLSRSDTRLQMLKATIDFLEKYNPAH